MLNIVFLSLLHFRGNTALKKQAAVTALSPGSFFHLLVVPAGHSRMLKLALRKMMQFGQQHQRLHQSVRANYNHKQPRAMNLLAG